MTTPSVLTSLEELKDFLANPHAHEELDEPILVVKLPNAVVPQDDKTNSGTSGPDEDLGALLRALPAVAVLLTEDAENLASQPDSLADSVSPAETSLARHFDIITDNATGDLDDITETVIASPQASVSLVQLLRATETLNVRDALMAESWVYSMLQGGHVFQNWLRTQKPQQATAPPPTNQPAVPTDDSPAVLIDDSTDTLRLTLNRPERRNAFSAEMRDYLVKALRAANPAPPPGGIILNGAGEAFCSGGDLNEFGTTPDSATAHIVRSLRSAAWEMHLLRDHIRVNLHGACVGAGIELPAFTNNITSTPDAFFWLPEVRLGLVPGAGGTVSLPRRIGRHRTTWLALTNRRLDPPTAKKWGLIDAIIP